LDLNVVNYLKKIKSNKEAKHKKEVSTGFLREVKQSLSNVA